VGHSLKLLGALPKLLEALVRMDEGVEGWVVQTRRAKRTLAERPEQELWDADL
jgi:hypothetical protein